MKFLDGEVLGGHHVPPLVYTVGMPIVDFVDGSTPLVLPEVIGVSDAFAVTRQVWMHAVMTWIPYESSSIVTAQVLAPLFWQGQTNG